MKKLFIVALIALFAIGMVDVALAAGPSGPGYSGDIMGMNTGRYASDPHRTFRMVRYGNPTQTAVNLTAGNIVIWDTTSSPAAQDGVTVCLTTTSSDARVAGQMVTTVASRDSDTTLTAWTGPHCASEDVGLRNWGWLQTYGLSTTNATAVQAIAAGSSIAADATAGQIGGFNGANTGASCGFTMNVMAAAGTSKIFLKCE
jgi:hypothetical protein